MGLTAEPPGEFYGLGVETDEAGVEIVPQRVGVLQGDDCEWSKKADGNLAALGL